MESKTFITSLVLVAVLIVAGCIGADETKAFKGKDCGTDLSCFKSLADTCNPTKVVYTGVVYRSGESYVNPGSGETITPRDATFTNLHEMRKYGRSGCQTYTKILDVKFAEDNKLTPEALQYYSSLKGKEAICISLMLNEPMYPTLSFLKSNCEGSLADAYSSDYRNFQEPFRVP